MVATADASVDAPAVPRQLVAKLPPLGPYRSLDELCRHASCNPPAPRLPPPATVTVAVAAIERDAAGSRVRFGRRDPRIDRRWEATFVDREGAPLAAGACAIVAWDHEAIECTTSLAPEQLVSSGQTYRVRVVPPPAPPPPSNLPARIVRVIQVRVLDAGSEVAVAEGTDTGITATWKASLVRPNGSPIMGGECRSLTVAARRSTCIVRLTMDQVQSLRVRLVPP